MAERGSGIVEVVGGEDEGHGSGADPSPEGVEPRARSRRQPREIDAEGGREPGESCRKAALRMLERWIGELRTFGRAISWSEEPGKRCLELRRGIAFSLGRKKQARPIRFALPAAEEPFAPVPEAEP